MCHLLIAEMRYELEAANCHVLVVALEGLEELQSSRQPVGTTSYIERLLQDSTQYAVKAHVHENNANCAVNSSKQ